MLKNLTMDLYFFVPIIALSAAIVALTVAYIRPPRSSVAALKRRMGDLEADVEVQGAKLERIKKRHYALEGHVYGSDDDEDEPGGQAPTDSRVSDADQAPAAGPLVPSDFPEAEFQDQLAKRRASRVGG